jgi:hypothetical protein
METAAARKRARGMGRPAAVIVMAMAAVAVLAGLLALVAIARRAGGKNAAARNTAHIVILAAPWGTVKSLAAADGSLERAVNQQTPVRVDVPPGEYAIVVFGANGREQSRRVRAAEGAPGEYRPVFDNFDAAAVAPGDPELTAALRAYYRGDFAQAEIALQQYVERKGPTRALAEFYLGVSAVTRFYLAGEQDQEEKSKLQLAARAAFRRARETPGFVPPEPYVSPKIMEAYNNAIR